MKLIPEIQQYLNTITEKYRDGNGLMSPKLMADLSIEVKDAEFNNPNIAGAIANDNGKWTVFIKESDFRNRKRFTACHELGHYISWMFHSHSYLELNTDGSHTDYSMVKSMNRDDKSTQAEREANEIAGCLLMPENLVKNLIESQQSIEEMSEEFGVSISAMTVRLQKLGYDLIEN